MYLLEPAMRAISTVLINFMDIARMSRSRVTGSSYYNIYRLKSSSLDSSAR